MDNYTSASLKFYKDRIVCEDDNSVFNGKEIMMSWEEPLMSASAEYVTQNGGDILEIGFGMGISADYIQSHNIDSHTIIENHPQVIEKLYKWADDKPNVKVIPNGWYEVKDSLGKFDGILFDTYGDDDMYQFSSSLSSWCKKGTKVTFWNNETQDTNFYNIPNVTYKEIGIKPKSNSYFTGSKTYYMPMVEYV